MVSETVANPGDAGPEMPRADFSDRMEMPAMPVWVFATIVIVLIAGAAVGVRVSVEQSFDAFHTLLSVFLAVNVMACYWEMCLYWRRDQLESRMDYWRTLAKRKGVSPARAYLTTQVPLSPAKILSPGFWSDSFAAYSFYDDAYADRSSCGFNVDVANGFWTFVPSVLLLVTYSSPVIPATVAGFIGVAVFYQWIYVTTLYMQSFFVAKRHRSMRRSDVLVYIWMINGFWILSAVLGFFVSVNLVMDRHYGVLGLAPSG